MNTPDSVSFAAHEMGLSEAVNWLLRIVIPEFSTEICSVEEAEAFASFPTFDAVESNGMILAWVHPGGDFMEHLEELLVGEFEVDRWTPGWEDLAGELTRYLRIAVRTVVDSSPDSSVVDLDSLRGFRNKEYQQVKNLVARSGLPANLGPLIVALAEYCELTYLAKNPENHGQLVLDRWTYCLKLLQNGEPWVARNVFTMEDFVNLPDPEDVEAPVKDTRAFTDLRYGKNHYLYVDDELLNLRLVNNHLLLEDAQARTDKHREPLAAMATRAIDELLYEQRTRQRVEEIMKVFQKSCRR